MFVLAAGLSYLSLNYISESKEEADNKKMSVALVNEDDGTTFEDEELDFGDQFVQSLDHNDDHDWSVVSRGVAENGFDQGTYDMQIVIPDDFSEKALSMHEDHPEQVLLDYKVNASDNEKVQAEAEEVVTSILNDFNERIIDVYFASVLGNLQDAQDNITTLVQEEADHTGTYNASINDPLSNYTDRFEGVKTNTETSRDRFKGFEDILDSFKEDLSDGAESGNEYQTTLDDTENTFKTTSELREDFMEQLTNYDSGLSEEDVDEQLESLTETNEFMAAQFKETEEDENEESTVIADTNELKKQLQDALSKVEDSHDELEQDLDEDLINEDIEEEVREAVQDAFDESNDLSDLFASQDKKARKDINNEISQLPSMDEEAIQLSSLSSGMKQEIKNVIQITKQYNDEFEQVEVDEQPILSDYVNELQKQLQEDGVTMTDKVNLPKNKNSEQSFELHDIPEEFAIEYLSLKLPGQDEKRFEGNEATEEITLPSNKEGEFTVELKLRLQEDLEGSLKEFDLYNEFAQWQWTLDQTNINDEDLNTLSSRNPDSSLSASLTSDNGTTAPDLLASNDDNEDDEENNSENEDNNSEDQENQNNDSDENDNESNDNDENEEEKENDSNDDNDENNENNEENDDEDNNSDENNDDNNNDDNNSSGDDDASNDNEDDDEDSDTEEVEVTDNKIHHQVTKPVLDESTENLIHSVEETIAPYQKLLSSYETYFDIDLSCEPDEEDCPSISDENLKDMSGSSSLYHLFNETDENDLLADYIVDQVNEGIQEEIRAPFTSLEEEMDDYRAFIDDTDENAEELIETVAETQEESQDLNDNVEKTMDNITNWRESSSELVDNQVDIQDEGEDEQTAVMALEEDFQPILTESQTLSEQASNNLDSADEVYQTFDRVDEQADSIQQSGTELVEDADNLSADLTDKLEGDEAFSENFSNVLPNSRIGNRQNEDLLEFMASPVDTDNQGLLVKGDTFTPYFLVLISFIVALFTAYVVSTTKQRHVENGEFEAERSLIASNTLLTGITACIGIVEGIVIGLLSAQYLGINDVGLITWTGLMIAVMLVMLLAAAYLLRQLKMIGMFILLAFMSMYLFMTKALGPSTSGSSQLRAYSPLQYIEDMLTKAVQGDTGYQVTLFGILTLILISALANLLVVHTVKEDKAKDEEHAAKNQ